MTPSLRYCLAYVFGDLLQGDIDEFVNDWNSHCIRKNRFSKGPFGRPTDMYDMPGQYGELCSCHCLYSCMTLHDKN